MNNLKSEKGSITLFVLVSMLFFILFLTGIYMISSSKEEGGIGQTARIKEIYEKDINNLNDVYATVIDKKTITLADATNANIGDYIDLGNDPLGKGDTTKNWRIFYSEGNTVYAILADYLPNSSGHATNAGLNTKNTYGVSFNNKDEFITVLKDSTKWDILTNGINGAKAVGTPTATQFKKSWDAKYPDNILNITEDIESTGISEYINFSNDDSLYVPNKEVIDNKTCYGYWLATQYSADKVCVIYCTGTLGSGDSTITQAIRPVVALPSSTEVIHRDNLWIVQK